MLNAELTESIAAEPNPDKRFTKAASVSIVIALAACIIFLFKSLDGVKREQYEKVLQEKAVSDNQVSQVKRENDSLRTALFIMEINFINTQKNYTDSVNREILKIKQTLTSK